MSDRTVVNGETFWPTHRVLYYDDGTSETLPIDPAEVAETEAANAAVIGRVNAQQDTFDLLNAATEAIREWCMDTQAWLYTQGAFGAFDEAGFLALVQQAESAGLAYNALPADDLTPALIQEQAGMALRGQQAQILFGLARGASGG